MNTAIAYRTTTAGESAWRRIARHDATRRLLPKMSETLVIVPQERERDDRKRYGRLARSRPAGEPGR